MEYKMLMFFGYLFVLWLLAYNVINLVNFYKQQKAQERFNLETQKYFKGDKYE